MYKFVLLLVACVAAAQAGVLAPAPLTYAAAPLAYAAPAPIIKAAPLAYTSYAAAPIAYAAPAPAIIKTHAAPLAYSAPLYKSVVL